MEKKNTMLKTASFMAIATLLAKVFGLLRETLIAAYFSTGAEGSAYLAATQLPMTLFDIVIGGVISASFIPIFNDILEKKDKASAYEFANRFIGIIFSITLLICVVGMTFSNELISLIAPGFDEATHDLAKSLSVIMFPMIIFTGLAFCFVGILQTFGEFNIPAIMSLISNLAVILYFPLFGKTYGVWGLSVAMLVSWSLQVFVQIPSLKKFGFRPRLYKNLWNDDIKRALLLAGPMLISTWVQPLYSIVNTRIASGIDGAVAILNYANRLYIVVTGVFSFVVTNLVFPKLSRADSGNKAEESKNLIRTSLKAVIMVIAPIMIIFMLLSRPIITVIYDHGAFDAVEKTSLALSAYAIGMIAMAINEVLSKTFFSMKDSKTPMINAILSMVANIVLAYVLSKRYSITGLALATAGGSWVNAILNYFSLLKNKKAVFDKSDIFDLGKIFSSAIIMTVVVVVLKLVIPTPEGMIKNLIFGGAIGIFGIIFYGVALIISKESDILSIIKKRN